MKTPLWIKRWQTLAALSLVAVMAMVIVACGGDEEDTPTPAAPVATPMPTPVPTQAPAPTPAPTMAPTTEAPTQPPAPTATQAPAAPAPTAPPTPTRQRFIPAVTATPAPTTPPPATEREPVQPRLRVAIAPPISQTTVQFAIGALQSPQGPMTGMFDTLLHNERYTEALEGYLAESWEISSDATEWKFTLRQNVPFYRGGQPSEYMMTVDDVIHSYDVNNFAPYQEADNGSVIDYSTADARHFDIISDHEFIWKLDLPNWVWGQTINSDDRRGVISKQHFDAVGWDGYIADPIGTGPFTFLDFELNQGISMERVQDHYRQTPLFHELEFFYVGEEATRSAMMYTNETDISEMSQALHEQAISRGYAVAFSTTASARFFMFIGGMFSETGVDGYKRCPPGTDVEPEAPFPGAPAYLGQCPAGRYEIDVESPMRDVRVREALNLAINRDEINDVFFKGAAVKQTLFNYPQSWPHHKDSWLPYDFDPDRARALLAEAGYADGFTMQIFTPSAFPSLPEIGDIMEALVSYFANVGVDAELKSVDRAQFAPLIRNREHTRGVIPSRWGAPTPGRVTGDFRNNVDWRQEWQGHPEVYEFISKMEAATSWEHLQELEVEATQWTYEQHLMIPLFWLVGQVVYNPQTVESYESRHIHMGPTRHHEFTVPVYK